MTSRTPLSLARHGLLAALAGTGAAGGMGLLAYVQARLATSEPGAAEVGYWVDGDVVPAGATDAVGSVDTVPTRRVVWIGDSLAAGLGAIAPDVSLPRLVASGGPGPVRLHSFAVPGATSTDVVERQLPALEQLRYGLAQIGERIDAVGVTVGGNDIAAFTPRRRLRRNLRTIVAAAESAPLVLVSIPQLGDALRLPRPLRTFASWRAGWLDVALRDVAARFDNVHYASVRRRPEWIGRRELRNFLAADRFHPSGAGYAVWADRVGEAFDRAWAPPATGA